MATFYCSNLEATIINADEVASADRADSDKQNDVALVILGSTPVLITGNAWLNRSHDLPGFWAADR